MTPMNFFLVRQILSHYKMYLLIFALLCAATSGAILAPIDKGIDAIEKSYPSSVEAMELVRKGTHGISDVSNVVKNVVNESDKK